MEWSNTSLGNLIFKLETLEERGLWIQWKEALKNKDNKRKKELEQEIGELVAKRILQDDVNTKYNAELAALEQTSKSKQTLVRQRVSLKTPITDFEAEAQELLNNPNPTIEEYDRIIGGYEFDLESEGISKELRKEIETKLQDLKNSFKLEQQTTSKKELIDKYIKAIAEQADIKTEC
jgi:hypothetical protein